MALMIGLPVVQQQVDFHEDTVLTEFGNKVRHQVHEAAQEELRRRKMGDGTKDNHVYKNFITTMVYICEQNDGEPQL